MQAITIGLDIAKSVFQVHGEDAEGKVVIQKRLGRKRIDGMDRHLPQSASPVDAKARGERRRRRPARSRRARAGAEEVERGAAK